MRNTNLDYCCSDKPSQKPYLNSAYADQRLWQAFYSQREEEGDRQFDGSVQGHRDKHRAGGDGVSRQNIDGKGHKDNDLAAGKEGGHVESSQVGTLHYLTDFFPGRREDSMQCEGEFCSIWLFKGDNLCKLMFHETEVTPFLQLDSTDL